jgi:hypothetical protein
MKPMRADYAPGRLFSRGVVSASIVICVAELFWFGSKCFRQIDFDGMAYTGLARHLREGDFCDSVNAFRSPLISWLIAALSVSPGHYLEIGKFVSICSFLTCAPLLYFFTLRLWQSRPVASLAVLLFILGRGLAFASVSLVTPDFLFAALVQVYFLILLRCFHIGTLKTWLSLGAVHGLAFLAKAFALPWLGISSVLTVLLSDIPWKARAARISCAALIPLIVATGWATVLHAKYAVFTTGSQFKVNFLQWTLRTSPELPDTTYTLLKNTTRELDGYVVDDPMPPGSWGWTYHLRIEKNLPKLLRAEISNVPKALKELTIVETPGVLLAFIFVFAALTFQRHIYSVEWKVVTVITVSFLSLIGAYSMLVFDGRYLYPLIPLVFAVGARFLIPDLALDYRGWRLVSFGLVVIGAFASLVYASSPFRTITRDFQVVSYKAGSVLRQRPGATLVSIGSGPFPEHGVGWEAGYQASYFGGQKLIGVSETLPKSTELVPLMADLVKASPDVVIVWGRPSEEKYADLVHKVSSEHRCNDAQRILDPLVGEVGIIFLCVH